MQGCSRLQTLATNRVRLEAPLEARVLKTGSKRAPRELSGKLFTLDQVTQYMNNNAGSRTGIHNLRVFLVSLVRFMHKF